MLNLEELKQIFKEQEEEQEKAEKTKTEADRLKAERLELEKRKQVHREKQDAEKLELLKAREERARAKQEQAVEDDYRVGMIETYIKEKDKVCIMELWKYALDNEYSKPTRRESNEITLILQSIGGWERGKIERHNVFGNQMFWCRIEPLKLPEINDDELDF
jgi:hypothetical protein